MQKHRYVWLTLVSFVIAVAAGIYFSFGQIGDKSDRLSISASAANANSLLPATVRDASKYGEGIQRTMQLLTTSTPEHRNTVRVLFYGQSITKQPWWIEVANDLKSRFPNANFMFENRAIGGFDSPKLVRTAEHDLYPYYPDLMIFHNYGDEDSYEAMIAKARRLTTTEVILISDHIVWMPTSANSHESEQLKSYEWHNEHSTQWLPMIAEKYGCELIDIRTPWEQYLKENQLQPQTLLADEIHLNDRGNALMAELVKTHLQQLPAPRTALVNPLVEDYVPGKDVQWKNGKLTLEFAGNRVDAIAASPEADRATEAEVRIDGKRPSDFPELYAITRPSNAFKSDQPAILQISAEKPLIQEDWMAVITAVDRSTNRYQFDVYGSKTGFDGSGSSDRQFVSNSGRVVIRPEDWWLGQALQDKQEPVPVGFQIHWRVEPLFADVYSAPIQADPSREYATTLGQNLSGGKHLLELIASTEVPLKAIRVYHPALP